MSELNLHMSLRMRRNKWIVSLKCMTLLLLLSREGNSTRVLYMVRKVDMFKDGAFYIPNGFQLLTQEPKKVNILAHWVDI